MPQDQEFQERVEQIDELVQRLDTATDPATRAAAKELVAAVMDLHAAGLERILEIVSRCGQASSGILESFTRDSLISSLLVLHSIHPDNLETRVRRAIGTLSGAEIITLEGSTLRLSVRRGTESTAREALYASAPDLTDVVFENARSADFVPLTALSNSHLEVRR